jgi:Na+/phosphate symporter
MSDLLGSIETSLAVDLTKRAISAAEEILSRWKVAVNTSQERLESAITQHQREVKSWAEEISFKDLP